MRRMIYKEFFAGLLIIIVGLTFFLSGFIPLYNSGKIVTHIISTVKVLKVSNTPETNSSIYQYGFEIKNKFYILEEQTEHPSKVGDFKMVAITQEPNNGVGIVKPLGVLVLTAAGGFLFFFLGVFLVMLGTGVFYKQNKKQVLWTREGYLFV